MIIIEVSKETNTHINIVSNKRKGMDQHEKLTLSVTIILIVIISVSVYLIERDTIDLSSYDIRLTNPDDLDTEDYALDAYDAVRIALKEVQDEQIEFIEVYPIEEISFTNITLQGEFWIVHIYHDPLEVTNGSFTGLSIDQTGTVLGKHRVIWAAGG